MSDAEINRLIKVDFIISDTSDISADGPTFVCNETLFNDNGSLKAIASDPKTRKTRARN